ncbi:hypothetical protein Tco_0946184 [Tanacetum coccineum]
MCWQHATMTEAEMAECNDSHNSGYGSSRWTDELALENQVKFATCTLHLVALTWWNTHVKIVVHDAAYGSEGEGLLILISYTHTLLGIGSYVARGENVFFEESG